MKRNAIIHARKALPVAIFLIFVPLAISALPSYERLAALMGRAEAISYSAKIVTLPDRTTWIRSDADIEAVFAGSLDDVMAILEDYENSPRVFSRIEQVRVRSSSADGITVTEQRSAVRIMGLAYVTNLVFRCENRRDGEDMATSTFRMIDGDGSTRSSEGGWSLEATAVDGVPAVYVRYRCSILVEPRFPMQLQIMQGFGKADFVKTVEELGAAMKKLRQGYSGSGPVPGSPCDS